MDKVRTILFFHHFFKDFFESQNERVKEKIVHVLFLVSTTQRIPRKFFEHIEGTEGLYCIRIEFESNIYRIFCCFDEGKLIILFNGFQKKTQKTPAAEIEKALKIKREYFTLKADKK